MQNTKTKKQKYAILSGVFAIVCAIFVARLINLQFNPCKTADLRAETKFTVETQTIQALRGNICDRNGNVLVTTSYAYDIIFDYNTMPDGFADFNSTILRVINLLNTTQNL